MTLLQPSALVDFLGRLHPVVLHLPIGLLAGLALLEVVALLRRKQVPRDVRRTLVCLLAAGALASAASGLLLAREGGPLGEALLRHRNLGLATTLVACVAAVAALLPHSRRRGVAYAIALALATATMIPTGHLGGELTHGAGFLTAPFRAVDEPVRLASSEESGDDVARRVLDRYCVACHGEARPKGRLVLAHEAGLFVGGASGPAIVPGQPSMSELIRRLRLPADDDERMPPPTKPQPTPQEIAALERWIGELAPVAASTPPPEAIAALLERRIHVEVIDPATGYLWIDCAAARDLSPGELVGLLAPLAAHIAELSLAGTSIGDEDFIALFPLPVLQRLDLTATSCGAPSIAALAASSGLESLILHRVALDQAAADALAELASLRRLSIAETGLTPEVVARVRSSLPECSLIGNEPLAVAPTALDDPTAAPTLPRPTNTHCPITGAPVDPRYTILRDGRAIGLCCPRCAEAALTAP